jgi:hypothetical protein
VENPYTHFKNAVLACQGCNNLKYTSVEARDPATGELAALYHPRRHRWSDHFTWNEEYTMVVGRTPTDRATVEKLQLNRDSLLNLRRVLRKGGQHPPPKFAGVSGPAEESTKAI